MARQAQRRSFRGGRGTRSPTEWVGIVANDPTVASTVVQTIGSVVPGGSGHNTVVRIVGNWQVDGAGLDGQVAIGAAVVNEAAFIAGAAAMPDPIGDIGSDMWTFLSSMTVATVARSGGFTDPINFDSRGMRKIEEGQRLVLTISNGTGGNIGFAIYIRFLLKLAIRS